LGFDNCDLAEEKPTRYRAVVLTSYHVDPILTQSLKVGENETFQVFT